MSILPRDMVEEILCRIPLTSMKTMRTICREWNNLLKDSYFIKKHILVQEAASREDGKFMDIMLINFDLFLMSFDLRGIYNNKSDDPIPFVKPKGKLISLDDSYKFDIRSVCHCDGLLLCTTKNYTKLVVWNPYTGQTRCISVELPSNHLMWRLYVHALGYDKSKSSCAFKILRFCYNLYGKYEIFDLNSNTWRIFDVSLDWSVASFHHHQSQSLKGNTYWLSCTKKRPEEYVLGCFDFTTEAFGPKLPLPFVVRLYGDDGVILSSLKEEQLAIILSQGHTTEIEIWVTTKIEPSEVLWCKFFAINMEPVMDITFKYGNTCLVDKEKRAVIVFDTEYTCNSAYIIGANGYFKRVDLGIISDKEKLYNDLPLSCSYVPSSAQINQSP